MASSKEFSTWSFYGKNSKNEDVLPAPIPDESEDELEIAEDLEIDGLLSEEFDASTLLHQCFSQDQDFADEIIDLEAGQFFNQDIPISLDVPDVHVSQIHDIETEAEDTSNSDEEWTPPVREGSRPKQQKTNVSTDVKKKSTPLTGQHVAENVVSGRPKSSGSSGVKKKSKAQQHKETFGWKAGDITCPPAAESMTNETLRLDRKSEFSQGINYRSSPLDFASMFLDAAFIDNVVFQTNLYNVQRELGVGDKNICKKVKPITQGEIYKFIGICLYMGIVKLPQRRMYWAPRSRVNIVAETMSRNRFEDILRTIHFNNNIEMIPRGQDGFNKLFKLQPLLDHFKQRFGDVVKPETMQSIDEMMVSFKGRSDLKQYLPKKPTKWGYKLWARAGVSGYIYAFEVYSGAKGLPGSTGIAEQIGESGCVVLRLAGGLPKMKHKLFFDNYFASPELLLELLKQGIFGVCTLRSDRSRGCPLTAELQFKKKKRGTFESFVNKDGNVLVCAWQDKGRVLTSSTYAGIQPIGQCQRWNAEEKKKAPVERPNIIKEYNTFMGGVDKSDMLLSLYKSKVRSRKWYMRIAVHCFSLAIVNAWIVMREMYGKSHDRNMSLLDFQLEVSTCYMKWASPDQSMRDAADLDSESAPGSSGELEYSGQSTEGGSQITEDESQSTEGEPRHGRRLHNLKGRDVPTPLRYDNYNHWPIRSDKTTSQHCQGERCKKRTIYKCSKCEIFLCVIGANCFVKYHKPNTTA